MALTLQTLTLCARTQLGIHGISMATFEKLERDRGVLQMTTLGLGLFEEAALLSRLILA